MEPDFQTMLNKTFGYKSAEAPKMEKPALPEPTLVQPEPTKKPRVLRTVGDVYSALQVQSIYNPNVPAPTKPKAPPVDMIDQGTSASIGTQGRWGTPSGE